MNLDPASLCVGLVLSSVGFGLFLFGRRNRRGPQLLAGVLLMVLPVVSLGPWLQLAIGALVVSGMIAAVRAGT